jgi:hypothetical protein
VRSSTYIRRGTSGCVFRAYPPAPVKKSLIGLCALVLLGSTIGSSLSHPPLIPLRGPADRLFDPSIRSGAGLCCPSERVLAAFFHELTFAAEVSEERQVLLP